MDDVQVVLFAIPIPFVIMTVALNHYTLDCDNCNHCSCSHPPLQPHPLPHFILSKERKRVLCVGLVCLDLVTVVDQFPKEDTDMRSSAQYKVNIRRKMECIVRNWTHSDISLKVRGGNANNSCRVLAELGFPATFLGSLAGQVADQPFEGGCG